MPHSSCPWPMPGGRTEAGGNDYNDRRPHTALGNLAQPELTEQARELEKLHNPWIKHRARSMTRPVYITEWR